MPRGKGTYGSQVGRPKKKKKVASKIINKTARKKRSVKKKASPKIVGKSLRKAGKARTLRKAVKRSRKPMKPLSRRGKGTYGKRKPLSRKKKK